MSSPLNPFNGWFDPASDKGIKLLNKALEEFSSAHKGKIKLDPCSADSLVKELEHLSGRYGFKYMMDNVPTLRRVIAADPDDEDAVETVEYHQHIKMLEHFSEANVKLAQKNATVLWGDGSWEEDAPKVIRNLNVGTEVVAGAITTTGKNVLRDRMHSKILARQVVELLDEDARRSIMLEAAKYTWTSPDGRETEQDGLVILALVLARVKPHYKADMFMEVQKLKNLTLKQFGGDVNLYFDEMKRGKQRIDQKDRHFYPGDQYVKDLLTQLKLAPAEIFLKRFEEMELDWMVGKNNLDEFLLTTEAATLYRQLKNTNSWDGQLHPRDQVVVLTTKIDTLNTQL